jgi:hypothetical protein
VAQGMPPLPELDAAMVAASQHDISKSYLDASSGTSGRWVVLLLHAVCVGVSPPCEGEGRRSYVTDTVAVLA